MEGKFHISRNFEKINGELTDAWQPELRVYALVTQTNSLCYGSSENIRNALKRASISQKLSKL